MDMIRWSIMPIGIYWGRPTVTLDWKAEARSLAGLYAQPWNRIWPGLNTLNRSKLYTLFDK